METLSSSWCWPIFRAQGICFGFDKGVLVFKTGPALLASIMVDKNIITITPNFQPPDILSCISFIADFVRKTCPPLPLFVKAKFFSASTPLLNAKRWQKEETIRRNYRHVLRKITWIDRQMCKSYCMHNVPRWLVLSQKKKASLYYQPDLIWKTPR